MIRFLNNLRNWQKMEIITTQIQENTMSSTKKKPIVRRDFHILAEIASEKRDGNLPEEFTNQHNSWMLKVKDKFETTNTTIWMTFFEVEQLVSKFEEIDSTDRAIKQATVTKVWQKACER